LPKERLTGSDLRTLFFWFIAAVAGALFAFRYSSAAFPEASVNFQVTRAQADERAREFISGLGENAGGYQSTTIFSVADEEADNYAKTYLERSLGLKEANRLMAGELNIWYWEVRFFRPLQKEEFRVRISPAGKIAGYRHIVEDARPGATLDRGAAEAVARQFLKARYGLPVESWAFLPEEASSKQQLKRLDWFFTWEKLGFKAKDAPYRLRVEIDGDRVGGAKEYLQVPEEWKRSYKNLRSRNDLFATSALIPYVLLFGAALWLAIVLTRRGQTRWKGAIGLGVVVAILYFLMQVNDWPQARAGYDTNASYGSFVAMQLAAALLVAVFSALTVTLVLPAAEPLYRVSQPGRLRLSAAITLRGWRTKEFFNASFVGLCFAAAHIGYVTAFYIVAGKLGAWAPQEVNYSNAVNTAIPWISGVAIGVLAASAEEFLFRLFAIPFLERLTKSRWLAVILPAFAWGFLHSNYPQEPGYARGIEIGLIGIVAGLVMLRWGILATLIWHYTVDALLVGLLLIRSDSLYFKVSGLIVGIAAVAPLAFSGISALARRGFEKDETLLNGAEPLPDVRFTAPRLADAAGNVAPAAEPSRDAPARVEAPEPPATLTPTPPAAAGMRYDPLSPGKIAVLAAVLIVGGLAAWKISPPAIDDYLKLTVDAGQARQIAGQTLRERGLSPESYRVAATFVSVMDPYVNEYLREGLGISGARAVYASEVPGALWRVRFFQDGQPEEYAVILRPDGTLHSVRHTVPESAPGASLTKEQAVARAEAFLRGAKKIGLGAWRLVESRSEKKPRRTDHTLVWEETAPLAASSGPPHFPAGEAHARLEIQVLGDEVTNYRTFVKIPEEWQRKQEEFSLPRTLYLIGAVVFFGGFAVSALVLYFVRLRAEAAPVPWRYVARWGAAAAALSVVNLVLGSTRADLLARYPTEMPLKIFVAITAVVVFMGIAFNFGLTTLGYGLGWAYAGRAFGRERLIGPGRLPAVYFRDAFCLGLGGGAALLAVPALLQVASSQWFTAHRSFGISVESFFYAAVPGAGSLAGDLLHAISFTAVAALAVSFVAAEFRSRWLRGLAVLLAAFFLVGSWGTAADFAKQFLASTVLLVFYVVGTCWFVRFNVLGLFLALAGSSIVASGAELLSQPSEAYRLNGYAVFVVLALLFAWPVFRWLSANHSKGLTSSPTPSV